MLAQAHRRCIEIGIFTGHTATIEDRSGNLV
jgi:hypothetical protein